MQNSRFSKDVTLSVIVVLALLFQSTLFSHFHWPLGGPNLALLIFIPWVMSEKPVRAVIIGFSVGIFLDLLPPGTGVIGQWALVLSVTAFALATMDRSREMVNSPLIEVSIFGVGTLVALLGWGFVGVIVGDEHASARYFFVYLPEQLLWNVILAPIVLPLSRKTALLASARR